MLRVIVRVKDKSEVKGLEKYGLIIYTSPIITVVGLEISDANLDGLRNDLNVISVNLEDQGSLLVTS